LAAAADRLGITVVSLAEEKLMIRIGEEQQVLTSVLGVRVLGEKHVS
jgi:hypothetical protein